MAMMNVSMEIKGVRYSTKVDTDNEEKAVVIAREAARQSGFAGRATGVRVWPVTNEDE